MTIMVNIRQASVKDASGIARVQMKSWKFTYRGIVPDAFLDSMDVEVRAESWTKQLHEVNKLCLVAEDSSGIVGFACGGELRDVVDSSSNAELYAIYLLPQGQRHGIGRTLMQALVSELQEKGFTSLLVWVLEQNPSVGFYKRLGGVQVAQKYIEIGGAVLPEIALRWSSLNDFGLLPATLIEEPK